MEPTEDAMTARPTPRNTLNEHRRTYDRMIGYFKYLIILVAFILLGMLVFLR